MCIITMLAISPGNVTVRAWFKSGTWTLVTLGNNEDQHRFSVSSRSFQLVARNLGFTIRRIEGMNGSVQVQSRCLSDTFPGFVAEN